MTKSPDTPWFQGWLVPGEKPVGEVLQVVNRSRVPELVPVPIVSAARKLLVFDRDRVPLGFFPVARDESGRALVYTKPNEPLFVFGVEGEESPKSTRPFMVRENAGRISLRIGQLTPGQRYTIKLWFKPIGKPETLVTDLPLLSPIGGFYSFPTQFREPGTYRFEVQNADGERLTSKGVYSHGSRREDMKTVEPAARRYAPVFSLTPEEDQVPVSPENMLGGLNPGEPVTFERWNGQQVTLPAEKLVRDVLPYEPGGTITPDKETTGLRWNLAPQSAAALSYVIAPDPDDRDLAHVSYEFFYRFDPKSGTRQKPESAWHPFDAEGVIVTMQRSGGEWRPVTVTYRHHVEVQRIGMYGMEQYDLDTDQEGRSTPRSVQHIVHAWDHGAVKVPYDKAILTPDGRPAVFASKAHASYPYPGKKGVGGYHLLSHTLFGLLPIPIRPFTPFEHAGGGPIFAPAEANIRGARPYALTKREAAETTEGVSSALSGKKGKLPVGSFSLMKTPEEIVSMYVREAEPMATSRVPREVIREGYRILKPREGAPHDTNKPVLEPK